MKPLFPPCLNRMIFGVFFLGIFQVVFSSYSPLQFLVDIQSVHAEESRERVEASLKSALIQGAPSLGVSEPWQKVIFQEEMLPLVQRFIKNYQASSGGIQADLDLDAGRRFLKFYAPHTLKGKDLRILVRIDENAQCMSCEAALPSVKQLVQKKLERRGMSVIWQTSPGAGALSPEGSLSSDALQQKILSTLLVQWVPSQEEEDTAHGDEKKVVFKLDLQIAGVGRYLKQKEFTQDERMDTALNRVWTELMTELGSKIQTDELSQDQLGRQEYRIEITGVSRPEQLQQIQSTLTSQVAEANLGGVELKVISREKMVFVLLSTAPREQVRAEINRARVRASQSSQVEWVLTP